MSTISSRAATILYGLNPKKLFAYLLVIPLLFCFTPGAEAQSSDDNGIRVGFFGVSTDNISEHYFRDINQRFLRQISRVEVFQVNNLGERRDEMPAIEESLLRNYVPQIADKENLNYAIGGRLENIEEDPDEAGLLRGRIFRYDVAEDKFHFLNIQREYVDLDEELLRFQNQFIQPIIPREESRRGDIVKWAAVAAVTGAVIIGSIYLYNSISTGGETDGPAPRPSPFKIQ